jgi:Flp pilus assembly protein TadD
LLILRATSDLDENRFLEAEKSLRKVVAKDPKNAQAYFYLGATMDKAGKFDEAMEAMKKAIELDPSNPEPFNYVGYSYAEKGIRLQEAERLIRAAVRLEPENPFYKDSLAWALHQQGKTDKAIPMQEEAIRALKKVRKDDAVMFEHLGDMYQKTGRDADAKAQWEKAVGFDPSLATVRTKLGLPAYVPPTPTSTPKTPPKKKPGKKKSPAKRATTASKP